jgi:hypothetical protein
MNRNLGASLIPLLRRGAARQQRCSQRQTAIDQARWLRLKRSKKPLTHRHGTFGVVCSKQAGCVGF